MRLRGEAEGNVRPEIRLDENAIRSYGAATLGELVEALAPQTRSGRGRQGGGQPIILLNGQRIAGFGEIRELPQEAIERVDILPEEAALNYGYRPDQRVINIILKENFRAVTLGTGVQFATAGGQTSYDGNASIVRISRTARWSIDGRYTRTGALLESERDLIQSAPALPFDLAGNVGASPFDPNVRDRSGAERSRRPAGHRRRRARCRPRPARRPWLPSCPARTTPIAPISASIARFSRRPRPSTSTAPTAAASAGSGRPAMLRFNRSTSESRLGLPSLTLTLPDTNPFSPFSQDVSLLRYADALGPLLRQSETNTGHAGLTLDSTIGRWRWTFTANYDVVTTDTRTDTNLDPAVLQARLDANDPAFNPFAPLGSGLLTMRPQDRAESTNRSGDAQIVFNGSRLQPARGAGDHELHRAGQHARPQQRDVARRRRSPYATSAATASPCSAASTCRSPAGARAFSTRSATSR